MSIVILFGIIVAVVFALAFVSNRRFGPLALALAAGSMLADFWASGLAIIIGGLGVNTPELPSGLLATVVLLMSPLLLLLFGGPRYSGKYQRIASAAMIALLTAALLVRPLGQYIALDGEALKAYKILHDWWQYVATAGLLIGLIDLFLLHSVKLPSGKNNH